MFKFVKYTLFLVVSLLLFNCNFLYATSLQNEVETTTSNSDNIDSYTLRDIAGYVPDDEDIVIMSTEEVGKTIFNDLILELRPYLKDVIGDDVDDNYVFSTKEVVNIIVGHPAEFVGAIYNYVLNSIKELFSIATENSMIVTE